MIATFSIEGFVAIHAQKVVQAINMFYGGLMMSFAYLLVVSNLSWRTHFGIFILFYLSVSYILF